MTACRRVLVAALAFAILALVTVVPGDGVSRLATPAYALGTEVFVSDPVLHPGKLYESDPSHGLIGGLLADANPAGGTNGYCIRVQNSDTLAADVGVDGFTVAAGNFVVAGTAAILDTDYYDASTPQRPDDIYCAVVRAPQLAPDELNGTFFLEWTYTDGSDTATIKLEIRVFRIELDPVDGVVGGAAEVCTVNWDPAILTGRTANDGSLPDKQDEVVTGALPGDPDWVITDGAPVVVLEKLGQYRDNNEWCLTFTANAATTGALVTLEFDALYRLTTNADDTEHVVAAAVDFVVPTYFELRHISEGGQIISADEAPTNVIGSRHNVCIIPTTAADTLDPASVSIGPTPGVSIHAFHNNKSTMLQGVPDGTLCFAYTSTVAGVQGIQAQFTDDALGSQLASWDANGDGNGDEDMVGAPLVKRWDTIAKTEITRGADHAQNRITNGSTSVSLAFNVADGTYSAGSIGLIEWVYGSGSVFATDPKNDVPVFLNGVILEARITSQCGYFDVEPPPAPFDASFDVRTVKEVKGQSVAGRLDVNPMSYFPAGAPLTLADGIPDDISISITNDPACNPASAIEIEIDAYYPDFDSRGAYFGRETARVTFQYVPSMMTPRVVWAGQRVNTTFAFGGGCAPYDGATISFTRGEEQPGTFLPGPGITLNGAGQATGTFRATEQNGHPACSFTVGYESEDPGEVDITVFFSANPAVGRVETTKVVFPLFFLVMEDVVVTASEDLVVSTRGDVSAAVRGWFPGTNPSGRPAVTFADGRHAPADRWVLPDDWAQLRGDADFRRSWPSSPTMPITGVTFLMENEGVKNSYPFGPEDTGGAGWFLLDGTEFSIDVNPHTKQSSKLGSIVRPRIISDLTDNAGVATVDSVGDLNLSFEECPVNTLTGNAHCGLDNVVGRTRYYAIADYPDVRTQGKHAPARSNVAETVWRWAGYKQVSVVEGEVPGIKYLVAHLKDRDGFCDAIFQNNTLGVKVEFIMDSGGGRIIGTEGRPWEISVDARSAVATTFDTRDDAGNVMNATITKKVIADDECQAWIRISNSLLTTTNVLVMFPAQPAPVPGDLRITSLQCSSDTVTVTNQGSNPISLGGFALRSRRNDLIEPEQHLGLDGYLGPGESKTFAGPLGWLLPNSGGRIFNDGGPDYARIVWNEFELHRIDCDGKETVGRPPLPLPPDGEREIVLDVVIPFAPTGGSVPLVEGWNLVTMAGKTAPVEAIVGQEANAIAAIYAFDGDTGRWERFAADAPAFASNLKQLETGTAYWVLAERPFTLTFP